MQHIYRIKSNQNWTCPKAGVWKVICVGGGASGGIAFGERGTPLQQPGGTTSFGSLLSATGGAIMPTSTYSLGNNSDTNVGCGGYGGWDGINYGGTPAYGSKNNSIPPTGNGGVLGSAGLGNGAGGGVGIDSSLALKFTITGNTSEMNAYIRGIPGKCGELVDGIFDLTANQAVACTIGTSTKPTINASTLLTQLKKYNSNAAEIKNLDTALVSNLITAGTSGIIYLEYLG